MDPATKHLVDSLLLLLDGVIVGSPWIQRVNGTTSDLYVETFDGIVIPVRLPSEQARLLYDVITSHKYSD